LHIYTCCYGFEMVLWNVHKNLKIIIRVVNI
jgi:hypothetical protein